MKYSRLGAGLAAAAVVALPRIAVAQLAGAEDRVDLSLSGYLRSLSGVQELGYDLPFGDRRSGFNSQVVRLKWLVDVDGTFRISIHNRLQLRLTTTSAVSRNVIGLGVSTVPDRTVDLEQILIEQDHVRLWHDIDRIAVTVLLPVADITVGRQAITWGISNLFPVADLWARFSPFELDTEEKPGLDALRALMYPGDGLELDIVLADRGALREFSAGARLTAELPSAEVYGAFGKFWRELIGMAGGSLVLDTWKLRAEVAVPWDLDSLAVQPVRATLGADWISADVQLTAEYHHNGLGSGDPTQYAARFATPQIRRGESYYVGRHYLGGAVVHQVTDRLSIAFSNLLNLQDPSVALTPAVTYDAGQRIRLSVGGLISVGSKPTFDAAGLPDLRSEYGTYGHFGYVQLSLYF